MQMARNTKSRHIHSASHEHVTCKTKTNACRTAGGQALIEVCVCMIGIVVILLAMLELTKIGMLQTMTMAQARANAASVMQDEVVLTPTADFLQTWDAAVDGKRYTADDVPVTASTASFYGSTVERSVSDASEWGIFAGHPNHIVDVREGSRMAAPFFGLLKGEAAETTELLPGFQRFIYGAETITIESEVWMTWTKGIY